MIFVITNFLKHLKNILKVVCGNGIFGDKNVVILIQIMKQNIVNGINIIKENKIYNLYKQDSLNWT